MAFHLTLSCVILSNFDCDYFSGYLVSHYISLFVLSLTQKEFCTSEKYLNDRHIMVMVRQCSKLNVELWDLK